MDAEERMEKLESMTPKKLPAKSASAAEIRAYLAWMLVSKYQTSPELAQSTASRWQVGRGKELCEFSLGNFKAQFGEDIGLCLYKGVCEDEYNDWRSTRTAKIARGLLITSIVGLIVLIILFIFPGFLSTTPESSGINGLVWDEAASQAQTLLASAVSALAGGLDTDIRTLALNVLAATGSKRPQSFHSSQEAQSQEARSYGESLNLVMENSFLIMLIPPGILELPVLLPNWCRRVGEAVETLKQHMLTSNRKPLTIHEILGNIYAINLAGHDTTANTMTYLMLLLAAYPAIQEWMAEESQTPETVRRYPAILGLPKSVAPATGNRSTEDILASRAEQLAREEIVEPQPGTYFPWSAGAQVCAAQKFTQVETVAVLESLFREHRLRVVLEKGEDSEAAQAHLVAKTLDTQQLPVFQCRIRIVSRFSGSMLGETLSRSVPFLHL
ncbi:uncharacterized protein BP01DRAFT_393746 [Aspergillus saccharolyticus JOP 1030-1]|uniref:Cytochrome P450 n=1 Tax=Aspergillus saccharolyticus JOP 1030-1 TaxID=1450539 RepID=A0A318Z7N6_9EURO|nr:hypothetical protein BP01DRAFT_393746 [Aspergillus saccharolyticus JOP 1030-1]PYH43186.1 hypothetical protein BP01DRAFT_393746 [Aspergillus saccharolyticus JOP 1030-1]